MAVALGFDAPRAFTLVSMRASRDPDFGVQLVGRILRVHRRLQGRAQAGTLPETLHFGYVFLADAETQTGLDLAGQRINAIQTEYAKASSATVALRLGEGVTGVSAVDQSGQIAFFGLALQDAPSPGGVAEPDTGAVTPEFVPRHNFDFGTFFGSSSAPAGTEAAPNDRPTRVIGSVGLHRYALRAGMPRHFKTQAFPRTTRPPRKSAPAVSSSLPAI